MSPLPRTTILNALRSGFCPTAPLTVLQVTKRLQVTKARSHFRSPSLDLLAALDTVVTPSLTETLPWTPNRNSVLVFQPHSSLTLGLHSPHFLTSQPPGLSPGASFSSTLTTLGDFTQFHGFKTIKVPLTPPHLSISSADFFHKPHSRLRCRLLDTSKLKVPQTELLTSSGKRHTWDRAHLS